LAGRAVVACLTCGKYSEHWVVNC